jgi:hypothetical protein
MASFAPQIGFSDSTLEPGIREYFQIGRGAEVTTVVAQIYGSHMQNSTKAKETMRGFATTGSLAQIGHGMLIPTDTWVDGYQTLFTHVKMGKIIGIDRESVDDDQYGIVPNFGRLLGTSARAQKEITGHAPFNNAFSTALSDGVSLISNAHPLPKAGAGVTESNVLATALDPSWQCLSNLNSLLMVQRDSAGLYQSFQDANKIWLVHPSFYDVAVQAVNSTSTNVVATGINANGAANANANLINPWNHPANGAGMIKVVASPWLTDTDASFLIAADRHEGYFFTRRDSSTPETWQERNPEAVFSKVVLRLSAGFADWRGIVGTAGA